jgi:hypothetical protein
MHLEVQFTVLLKIGIHSFESERVIIQAVLFQLFALKFPQALTFHNIKKWGGGGLFFCHTYIETNIIIFTIVVLT